MYFVLKTTSLCTFVANKSQIHRGNIFAFSDSLPTVKSNTVFGKINTMALEKYSLEIEENVDLAWRDEQQHQHPMPETEKI